MKSVQRMLGHASAAMTLDIYARLHSAAKAGRRTGASTLAIERTHTPLTFGRRAQDTRSRSDEKRPESPERSRRFGLFADWRSAMIFAIRSTAR